MGRFATALLPLVMFGAACVGGGPPETAPSPTGDPALWRSDPEEPFPFTTPIPPLATTVVDGAYTRNVETGSVPIPCRRCAPYRLDRGAATLRLESGRFFVDQASNGFSSIGHFIVEGDRITFFNDPNCPETAGIYRWTVDGDALTLEAVDDDCAFDLLRARYLAAEPWVRVSG